MYGFKLIFYFFEVLFMMTGFNDEQSQIVFTHQQLEVFTVFYDLDETSFCRGTGNRRPKMSLEK